MEEFLTAFDFFRDEFPDETLLKTSSGDGFKYYESPTYRLWKQDTPTKKYVELHTEKYRASGYFERQSNEFRIFFTKIRHNLTPKQKRLLESRGFTVDKDTAHISTYPLYQFVR